MVFVWVEDYKIVGIADVVFCFEFVPHEPVKLVHADINQKLGGQVAQRQTFAFFTISVETADDFAQKPHNISIGDVAIENFQKNLMVNTREELPDIALQNPAGSLIIPAGFPDKSPESIYSFVSSLVETTGIRVGDEQPVKERVKNPVNSVMEQTVADTGFVDVTRFGVVYFERLV